MRDPAGLNVSYKETLQSESNPWLQQLRAALPNLDPAKYRGIERCPLAEDPIVEPWLKGEPQRYRALEERDVAARLRFIDIVGPTQNDWEPCTVPTLAHARELLSLVDRPAECEIVRLEKAFPELRISQSHLGFDVGYYWGYECYSIVCDS